MVNLRLEEEPFRAELEVVKNERLLRVDNDPDGKMDEVLWSRAFTDHPYHWPTIGWMEHLEAMSLEDARAFYKSFYAPNRAVIVVAGDLTEAQVLAAVVEHFGPLEPQAIERPERRLDPPPTEERREELRLPLAADRLLIGYRAPAIRDPDLPAAEILAEILFNSDSSRVDRVLVHETELAMEVSGWLGSFEDPSLFQMAISCQQGHVAEEALDALDGVLSHLLDGGVTQAEVDRARNKIRMSLLRSMLAIHSKAYQLGFYEVTAGDFRQLFAFMEGLDSVSPASVLAVARRMLRPEARTVIIGRPSEKLEARGGGTAAGRGRTEAARTPPTPGPLALGGDRLGDARDDLHGLGGADFQVGPLKGLVVHDADLPYIAFALDLYRGSEADPPDKEGTAHLCGQMLLRGTARHTRRELAEALDSIGSRLDVRVHKGTLSLYGDCAAEHLEDFLQILAEVLWRPSFPEDELEKLRRQTLSEIEAIKEYDASLARHGFSRLVYEDHPWARPTGGTEESVGRITVEDIRAFYAEACSARAMLLGASGAITAHELASRIAAIFPSPMPAHAVSEPEQPPVRGPRGLRVVLMDKPERSQTQVLLGHTTLKANHPDVTALSLANTAFGGTFTARMMQEVRVKRGWSYGAYSRLSVGRELSTFHVSFYPKTEDTVPALRLVLEMLAELCAEGITPEELTFAKSYSTNAFPFSLETHPKRLHMLMAARYLRRPARWIVDRNARIAAVDLEATRAALGAHLDPKNLVVSITCTASELLDELRTVPGITEILVQPYDRPWAPEPVPLAP